jgi:hypothetical protein
VLAHFAGKVGQDKVSVLIIQLYPEHGIWEGFLYDPFHLYCFFFCHSYSWVLGTLGSKEPWFLGTKVP